MALFGRKKTEEKKEEPAKEAAQAAQAPKIHTGGGRLSGVLRNPRITEKGSSEMALGVYTFDVSPGATKQEIAQAIYEAYNVRPRMVRIVPIRRKTRRNARTGVYGVTRGGKKAYVYLKKGESITVT